jgi:hypothetical protein
VEPHQQCGKFDARIIMNIDFVLVTIAEEREEILIPDEQATLVPT